MDSKLVVEQMSGHWKIKHPDLIPLAGQAARRAGGLGRSSYTWVPREQNAHADRLANEAMDESAGRRGRASQARAVSGHNRPATEQAGGPPGQAAMTTMLLRHGETPLSIERRFAGRWTCR